MPTRTLPILLAAALCASAAQAQTLDGQPAMQAVGEPAIAEEIPLLEWRGQQFPKVGAPRRVFTAPAASKLEELERHNSKDGLRKIQVGIARLPAEAQGTLDGLRWQPIEGGAVARVEVQSVGALALRVGLRVTGADPRLEFRFAGSAAPTSIQALHTGTDLTRLVDDQGLHWTPITDGDVQMIEIFAPANVDASALHVTAPMASHLVTSLSRGMSLPTKIGESDSCNVDTACRVATLGQNFVNAKNAVARMSFVDGGFSYNCTGTLLNDTEAASQVPYFYTANHCMEGSQATANTLTTLWNYEATSCGSGVSAATIQRTGGADILASNADDGSGNGGTDAEFLRLRSTPPAGAFYAGWDANPLGTGVEVLAIHHPQGDVKKSSLGQAVATYTYLNEVGWVSGTTQQGSSGSGLFTNSQNGYMLRGGLYAGEASCASAGNLSHPDNWDVYSRLDVFFPQIQQYLAPAAQTFGPSAGRDYTGPWNVPTEAGWGLTMFQFDPPTNYLFALIFIYDDAGVAKWYEYSGSWTATDVSSGDVLESTAAPWGPTYNPANRAFTPAGTATLTFTSATTANITFTVEGVTRTAAIQMIQ